MWKACHIGTFVTWKAFLLYLPISQKGTVLEWKILNLFNVFRLRVPFVIELAIFLILSGRICETSFFIFVTHVALRDCLCSIGIYPSSVNLIETFLQSAFLQRRMFPYSTCVYVRGMTFKGKCHLTKFIVCQLLKSLFAEAAFSSILLIELSHFNMKWSAIGLLPVQLYKTTMGRFVYSVRVL